MSPATLAREFPAAMISPWFKPNGTIVPPDRAFRALAAKKFADFKLTVDGLVQKPLALSLADLRGLPGRTQVTRHDCVEGWSCIGQWSGVPLAEVLNRAGLKPQARYAVFHCADTLEYAGGGLEGGDGASLWRPEHPGSVRDGYIQLATAEDWGGAPAKDDAPKDDWGQGAPEPEAPEDKRTPLRYYESIDLFDAFNPQTILAYDLNDSATLGSALALDHFHQKSVDAGLPARALGLKMRGDGREEMDRNQRVGTLRRPAPHEPVADMEVGALQQRLGQLRELVVRLRRDRVCVHLRQIALDRGLSGGAVRSASAL